MGCEDYEPYGEGWKREVARLRKDAIIELLAKVGRERDFYMFKWQSFQALATDCKNLCDSASLREKTSTSKTPKLPAAKATHKEMK